jgi:hypothetical protein
MSMETLAESVKKMKLNLFNSKIIFTMMKYLFLK